MHTCIHHVNFWSRSTCFIVGNVTPFIPTNMPRYIPWTLYIHRIPDSFIFDMVMFKIYIFPANAHLIRPIDLCIFPFHVKHIHIVSRIFIIHLIYPRTCSTYLIYAIFNIVYYNIFIIDISILHFINVLLSFF